MNIEYIGISAAFLSTVTFIPQAFKIIKYKDVASISLFSYIIYSLANLLWLIYGVLISNTPIVLCNGITFPIGILIVYLKLRINSDNEKNRNK